MKLIFDKYAKFIPYLYFISIVALCFTYSNKSSGIIAYPILLLGVPFLWQIIKPNDKLNFMLGISFVCISSYLIIVFLLIYKQVYIPNWMLFTNLAMALWIIKNSLQKSF